MEKFSKTLRGYNPKEVNDFLDNIITQVDKMVTELKEKETALITIQKEKNDLLEQINRYKAMETTMNKTIVAAQDSSEQIRRIAKQEGDMILNEAKTNANRIVSDALLRAERTEFETAQLRKNLSLAKKKLHGEIETLLDSVDDIEILDI